jgi:hypothetical protein
MSVFSYDFMPCTLSSTLEEYQHRKLNQPKEDEFTALLPNLRVINGELYFIPNRPIKLSRNTHDKFHLENISFTGTITAKNIKFKCTILPEECSHGAKLHVTYYDQYQIIDKVDMKKVARAAEARILGINIFDDEDDKDYDENVYDIYNISTQYLNDINNDEYSDYGESYDDEHDK